MGMVLLKGRIRRVLHFIFTLFFVGDVKFLLYVLRVGGLGQVSSFVENSFLFECASFGAGKGAIVEVGSFKGRTTVSLAYGSKSRRREKVYAIDPQENQQVKNIFLNNIRKAGLQDHVIPVFKKSEEAAKDFKEPIRLLFIDGCHDYAEVKKDILCWKGFLADGGILVMHDYLPKDSPQYLEGVYRAVEECVLHNPEFVVEGVIDSVFFASKKYTDSKNREIFDRYKRIERLRSSFKSILNKSALKYV